MKHETWIVLLRGINVGGKNKLRMKELVALLETLGFVDIKTYIQSGNVVFQGPKGTPSKLATTIASAIEETFDFRPNVIALTKEAFEKAAAANPFPEAKAAQDGQNAARVFSRRSSQEGGRSLLRRGEDSGRTLARYWFRLLLTRA